MSYLMDYVMRNYGIKSDHVDIEKWPIITDDNFESCHLYGRRIKTKQQLPN